MLGILTQASHSVNYAFYSKLYIVTCIVSFYQHRDQQGDPSLPAPGLPFHHSFCARVISSGDDASTVILGPWKTLRAYTM